MKHWNLVWRQNRFILHKRCMKCFNHSVLTDMTTVRNYEVVFDKYACVKRSSAAARPLRLWFRIPPGHGCLSCMWCAVRGLCDEAIASPEESYRLWSEVLWRCGPARNMASSFLRFLDHTHND